MLDEKLIDELGTTHEHICQLREKVQEQPIVPTAKGDGRLNPHGILLRDAQAYFVRLAKLMTIRKTPTPPADMDRELTKLLDD